MWEREQMRECITGKEWLLIDLHQQGLCLQISRGAEAETFGGEKLEDLSESDQCPHLGKRPELG